MQHHPSGPSMELDIFLILLLCNCLNGDLGGSQLRQKRGLVELAGAIECGTGRSSLLYLGYGCYCGIGGQGSPKDQTDWCCNKHDCCYGLAEQFGCYPKSNKYQWKCVNNAIKCENTKDVCQKIVCNCDKELAKCLRKAPYKAKYALYPNFLCGEGNPQCRYYDDDD